MSSNLPPGVTENMIPGNRPEDAVYESLFEELPKYIQDEIENDTEIGKKLDYHFQILIDKIFTEDDVINEVKNIEPHLRDEIEKEMNYFEKSIVDQAKEFRRLAESYEIKANKADKTDQIAHFKGKMNAYNFAAKQLEMYINFSKIEDHGT